MRRPERSQKGYTIIEVMIAVAILALISQAFAVFMRAASQATMASREKAQAAEVAVQLAEELRSIVLDNSAPVDTLDAYNDGADEATGELLYKYTLSTKHRVTHDASGNTLADYQAATNPLSNNPVVKGGYQFVRRVVVTTNPLDPGVRNIQVLVYKAQANPGPNAASTARPQDEQRPALAEAVATVRSATVGSVPTQVLEVYIIALESVPGWWTRMSNMAPMMRASILSLQARNPGLKIVAHEITRMSYGRDPEYTPELNKEGVNASDTGAFKKAYVYPGWVSFDDSVDYYYLWNLFRGRMNFDGTIDDGSHADDQSHGYALADQYNHAMRYPDEERLYEIHRLIGQRRGETVEPSLRLLLERMNQGDPAYRNSILINLHGELVPIVPLRNYSDGARDPQWFATAGMGRVAEGKAARAWRVVTHPERLRYDTATAGQEDQAVRVYAWDMAPPADPITAAAEDDVIEEVTLFFPGLGTANLRQVERVQGNSRTPYYKHVQLASAAYSTGGTLHDGLAEASSLWLADDYSPPGRNPGLRIRLRGVTPTARAFNGPVYIP